MSISSEPLVIAGRIFRSRLILGTGKFSSHAAMRDALEASGAELVTVALRRADLTGPQLTVLKVLEGLGDLSLSELSERIRAQCASSRHINGGAHATPPSSNTTRRRGKTSKTPSHRRLTT